jgi:hypothetical protein
VQRVEVDAVIAGAVYTGDDDGGETDCAGTPI